MQRDFLNYRDVTQYFDKSVVFSEKHQVPVTIDCHPVDGDPDQDFICDVLALPDFNRVQRLSNLGEVQQFDFSIPFRYGNFELEGGVYYCKRMAKRQWKGGPTSGTLILSKVDENKVIPFQYDFFQNARVNDMLMGWPKISLDQAKKRIQEEERSAVALSRNVSVHFDQKKLYRFFYKTELVGYQIGDRDIDYASDLPLLKRMIDTAVNFA